MLCEYDVTTRVNVELSDVIVPRSECQFTQLRKKKHVSFEICTTLLCN